MNGPADRHRGVALATAVALALVLAPLGAADPSPLRRGEFVRELLLTGELRAVRSVEIKAPQTNMFQMRIQFMAEEGSVVAAGDSLLDFDNAAMVEQVRDLENRILDAEIQIVTRRNEMASALKDLEIELAEKEYEDGRARLEASVDPAVLSRKENAERQLASTKATEELQETKQRIELTRERGQADLDVLTIERDKLRKDLSTARQSVERLSIRAPKDGLVVYERREGTTLRHQEGDSCWPGQVVIRLPDLSEMQVEFAVSEVDVPLLQAGLRMRLTLDAFPGRELQGAVVQIPSMAVKRNENSKIAVFKVLASLDETWVGEMKPGMSVLGRAVVERRQDVPLVERAAVQYDGTQYWWIDSSRADTPQRVRIEPIDRNESFYVLSEEEFRRLAEGRADAGGGDT